MKRELSILTDEYLKSYSHGLSVDIPAAVRKLRYKHIHFKDDFEYYIQSSATHSSNIEGNSIDVDTYLRNKRFKIKSKPKEMGEIDALVEAYNFAMEHKLTEANFFMTHSILSAPILTKKSERGKLRKQQVGIYSGGKLEYMAVEPEYVKEEFDKLFSDVMLLSDSKLTYDEVFYYAAMIHLMFEKIHPFTDGNGRSGRLLEKWFLSEKIGKNAWSLPSEQYYSKNKADYYKNIHIGFNYYVLKMNRCVPFLHMLPHALIAK